MQEDVNARIRQSQGQMQQAYTLHTSHVARRAGRRHHVPRQRCTAAPDRQGLRERRYRRVARVDALHRSPTCKTAITELQNGPAAHRHASRDVRDASRAGGGRRQDARLLPLDLEGGHARGSALPVEREDALRQDLHHLPARQEARCQARARGDLQAGGRGRVADRPRVPCRLRRLAVPLALIRQRPDARSTARSRVVYFGSFQDLLGRDSAGNIKPKNEWLHADQLGPRRLRRVPLRRVARHREGAVRGRGRRGRQEGDQARVRRRP